MKLIKRVLILLRFLHGGSGNAHRNHENYNVYNANGMDGNDFKNNYENAHDIEINYIN